MIVVQFKCDCCGRLTQQRNFWKQSKGESAHKDRSELILSGWKCTPQGIDICDKCMKTGLDIEKAYEEILENSKLEPANFDLKIESQNQRKK